MTNVYARFLKLCRDADAKYNSGLFDFATDTLTPALKIDDDKLSGILRALYYPQSPYEFSVLADDTLGNVYEQFLGKVIRLTPAHQAKIEEKPAVKKAGGVFYTPRYIVDYIVAQTVGKMIAGKSPDDLAGHPERSGVRPLTLLRSAHAKRADAAQSKEPFRVLDPACGSGSFLLGAYEFLLAHCLAWYVAHRDDTARERIYESARGWRLTTAEKKRILTTHIFGVDIDRQAVEVTKLSLLLKVLEDETHETLGKQLTLFKERALPNLDANIRCGNSLIEPIRPEGFFETLRVSDEEYRRVNPFDWARAFPRPEGFSKTLRVSDGFDCIIGNPPYVRIQTLKEWAPLEVEMYKEQYAAARAGNYDIYVVFVEKALQLLNARGRMGFILPHKFFNAQYGEPLRELIARGKHLARVIHFGDQQIFAGATTYTCLMFLDQAGADACAFVKVDDLNAWRANGTAIEGAIPATRITNAEWNFAVGKDAALFERLRAMPVKLENVTSRIFQGIKTSADKIYIVEELERKEGKVKIFSRETESEYWVESDLFHPLIKGGDSKRYNLIRTNRLILFPYAKRGNETALIPETDFDKSFPLTWAYLMDNKKYLENREDGKMRGNRWYGYIYPKALDVMPLSKIFTPDIANRSAFSLDASGEVFFTGGVAGGYGILVLPEFSRAYILGLLNSRLLEWFNRQTATQMRGGYYSYESRYIRNLPIRALNLADAAEKAQHDQMVARVSQMLELHTRRRAAQTAHDRDLVQRQIDATDAAIDDLVYALYGVTEEERKVVEGK
ncbi:MAG: Eco57I restriction-modification methylase domain-containing protein [Chloroflexi bacterium]|nr:Eco57I restriction-modification methylase domain-containing protein [Chloroflexota bacterium]